MCRNIRTLFNFDPPASDDEVRAASVQFVRKLSGFDKPSHANEAAFNRAVDDIAAAVLFFLSEDTRQVTGMVMDVDGGNHLQSGGWSPFAGA